MVYSEYKDSMAPKYSFPASRVGAPTSPMTAKQLKEFGERLNEGVKNIEVGALDPTVFETIPTEHFEEIRRMAALGGAKPSLHAPLLDISGFQGGEQGSHWSEEGRLQTQQQLVSIMERANLMSGKDESIPVVVHSGNTFAQEYDKSLNDKTELTRLNLDTGVEEPIKDKEGKQMFRPGIRKLAVVNPSTGRISIVEHDTKYRPEFGDLKEFDPWQRVESMNKTEWDEEKLKIFEKIRIKNELVEKRNTKEAQNQDIARLRLNTPENDAYNNQYIQNQIAIKTMSDHISEIDAKINSEVAELHDRLKSNSPLKNDPNYKVYIERVEEYDNFMKNQREQYNRAKDTLVNAYHSATSEDDRKRIAEQFGATSSKFNTNVLNAISDLKVVPYMWKPVNEFAKEKAAETVASAMYMFHKNNPGIGFDKMPTLALENFMPHTPISRGDELKEVIDSARKIFVEKLVSSGQSEEKAKDIANAHIGATWDVGHINLLRKAGYDEKEIKDIGVKELRKVAKDVKHLHITDNFGFHDSHLPPGMGNVPIEDVMKELEAAKFAGRAIIEAGGFVKEFEQSPTHHVFEYFNSPLYSGKGGPYWGPERYPGYRSMYVEFPREHFNMYGSSFSTLPKVFGGQVGNDKSRFSDTPNA